MMYIALLVCLSVCLAGGVEDAKWQQYKLEYGKVYTEEEDAARYETWKENVAEIDMHNALYSETYEQGPSEFSDMTDEEFAEAYLTGIPDEPLNATYPDIEEYVPQVENRLRSSTVDWRGKGLVTGVKNQGRCGSCYSFSATGSLEGQWKKKTGRLISLSEQQIVDCSSSYGDHGCHGGWYHYAWKYLRAAGGSESEAAYPYETRQSRCRFNRGKVVARVTGLVGVRGGDENDLKNAVGHIGPIAVAIDASRRGFRNYRRGVFYDRSCSSRRLSHAVLAVGYGSEGGMDYWLVKNSWGTRYGAGGYIKMARNKRNHCGIATRAAYPTV